MPNTIFITGASGFLGRHLIRRLLRDTRNVLYVLARSQTTEEDLIDEFAWADVARIKIVRGDVTLPRLGLGRDMIEHLATKTREVWHTAAATQFADAYKDVVDATNVHGTHNVLGLSSSFPHLHTLYYMSTAYVCGVQRGRVAEDALPKPMAFNNHYERSKYEAERLVRSSRLPFVIVRPSILVGDSHTGEARGERSRVIYGYILAVYHAILRLFASEMEFWSGWKVRAASNPLDVNLRLYGSPLATKNFLTVDDAVNVCMAVRASRDKIGKTFNAVNANNLTLQSMLDSFQPLLKVRGIRYEPGLSLAQISVRENPAEAFAFKATRDFRPYAIGPEPRWVTDNVDRLGVQRIRMTRQLFRFVIRSYVQRHLRGRLCR